MGGGQRAEDWQEARRDRWMLKGEIVWVAAERFGNAGWERGRGRRREEVEVNAKGSEILTLGQAAPRGPE